MTLGHDVVAASPGVAQSVDGCADNAHRASTASGSRYLSFQTNTTPHTAASSLLRGLGLSAARFSTLTVRSRRFRKPQLKSPLLGVPAKSRLNGQGDIHPHRRSDSLASSCERVRHQHWTQFRSIHDSGEVIQQTFHYQELEKEKRWKTGSADMQAKAMANFASACWLREGVHSAVTLPTSAPAPNPCSPIQ